MSKAYRIDMTIDISDLHPSGGLLMKNMPKEKEIKDKDGKVTKTLEDNEWDSRGFKEQTGAEIFHFVCEGGINGANPKVSYDQGKTFRKIVENLKGAIEKSEFIANKTEIDIIKNSIRGNRNWPNTTEMFNVLDRIMEKLDNATEITENPSSK